MKTISRLWVLALILSFPFSALAQVPTQPAVPGTAESIPPTERPARHFATGEAFLRALPEGTQIKVERIDNSVFALTLDKNLLKIDLPKSLLSADKKTLTTPFGYKLLTATDPTVPGFRIVGPHGKGTTFQADLEKKILVAFEDTPKRWERNLAFSFALRLPDGSRIDMLQRGAVWEILTLWGERFRLALAEGTWAQLESIPSPPLIPDLSTFYVAGNGSEWRLPGKEEHFVFAWNWFPGGLSIDQMIADLKNGPRRKDLDDYFVDLPQPQSPEDMGAIFFARRLALDVGDRITFLLPGKKPVTVFLLPSPAYPDYFELREEEMGRPKPLPRGK